MGNCWRVVEVEQNVNVSKIAENKQLGGMTIDHKKRPKIEGPRGRDPQCWAFWLEQF